MRRIRSARKWAVLLGISVFLASAGVCHAQDAVTAAGMAPEPDGPRMERHVAINEKAASGGIDLVFIGDDVTEGWEKEGSTVWAKYYGDRGAANLGGAGDRTYNVLWRLENGNLKGISPKVAVVLVGASNGEEHSAEEIAEGVVAVVNSVREKCPKTQVLLVGILPREEQADAAMRVKMNQANELASKCADGKTVHYMDVGREFLNADGTISAVIMPDFANLSELGYKALANAIEPKVALLLGEIDEGKAPKGFEKLFNGKDLTGWEGLPTGPYDNPEERANATAEDMAKIQAEADQLMNEHWKVVNGALEYDGQGFSLATAKDYKDFEMLVDWKIHEKGDSGIYLRGTPQVQIWDPAQWPQGSGGLYNNQWNPKDPLVCADNPIGEWNTFRIKMIGERTTIYLNDKLVVDNVILENYWKREIPIYLAEQIELQHHGSTLWFKNIFIREIPEGEGFEPLFNGVDLTGWEPIGAEKMTWGVEDGLLYTDGTGGGWLFTTKEYSDFELEVEFRVPENGNSGVAIRAPHEGNPAYSGMEIQVLDDYGSEYTELNPWQYCGSLYSIAAPARRASLKAGEWQEMRIRALGPHIAIWLNGVPLSETDLTKATSHQDHPGMQRTQGYIALQNHGSRLDYRNIRIRELK